MESQDPGCTGLFQRFFDTFRHLWTLANGVGFGSVATLADVMISNQHGVRNFILQNNTKHIPSNKKEQQTSNKQTWTLTLTPWKASFVLYQPTGCTQGPWDRHQQGAAGSPISFRSNPFAPPRHAAEKKQHQRLATLHVYHICREHEVVVDWGSPWHRPTPSHRPSHRPAAYGGLHLRQARELHVVVRGRLDPGDDVVDGGGSFWFT